ncbi:MAG: DUF2085 domain-containing protein [Anaerolineae bacterium]
MFYGSHFWRWGVITLVVLVFTLLLSPLWPVSILVKADAVAYAVCHRLPDHSFHLAGRQLPLCARCTGTFLGAFWGFLGLMAKGRASRFPPVKVLIILVGFIVFMGVDGLNSYLSFFPSLPHLYEPRNSLRLITGTLYGLSLSILVFPVFNFTLWREAKPKEALSGFKELSILLVGPLFIFLIVQAQIDALLYPLALASALGVLLIFTLVNTLLILVVSGREGQAMTWGNALLPLALGLGATLLEIGAVGFARAQLTRLLGLPF